MAPPNTFFTPVIARRHANAFFFEVMLALQDEMGIIDIVPDAGQGGDFIRFPRLGRLSTSFERVDVKGTITGTLTANTQTFKEPLAPVLHRSMLHEYFHATPITGGLSTEEYSAMIGEQMGREAAITFLKDMYTVSIAAARAVSDDHDEDIYANDSDPSDQVDFSATAIQNAMFLLGDQMNTLDVGAVQSKQWNDLSLASISTAFNVPNIMGDVYREGQFRTVQGINWIVDDQVPKPGVTSGAEVKNTAILYRSRRMHPDGLAPVFASFQSPLEIFDQHVLGTQSIKFQRQPIMSYAIGVQGMAYDTAAGTNPDDSILDDPTAWVDAFSDHKEVGIVVLQTN